MAVHVKTAQLDLPYGTDHLAQYTVVIWQKEQPKAQHTLVSMCYWNYTNHDGHMYGLYKHKNPHTTTGYPFYEDLSTDLLFWY